VNFYCSRLNGNKICWPVEVLRTNADGWHYVRGLAGRFKGRSFTVVGSEVSSYVPSGYKLAPGAKAFLPKLSKEHAEAKKLALQVYKLIVSDVAIPISVAQKFLRKTNILANSLQPRTHSDISWRYVDKDLQDAAEEIKSRRSSYAMGKIHSALGLIAGAGEREKSHERDPFFGKKLGGRAKSRLSEGREKQKFDRLYTGFKREGSSATTAYRKAIKMMPGYHTPAAQKAWLEDLAEYEKHAHLIDKNDHFHMSLRDRDPIIRKVGKKFVLYSIKTGKRLGSHPSRAAALRQERAIHAPLRGSTSRRDPMHSKPRSTNKPPYAVARVIVYAKRSASGLGSPLAERAVGVFHKEDGTWEIADNFERFSDVILDFKDGQWTARRMYGDYPPKKISQQEAEANAKLMFTDAGVDRDPSTSKSYFIIATRLNDPKYGGRGLPWTTMRWTMVGNTDKTGTMTFKTRIEAERAISEIRTYGPDWAAAEYKVFGEREITTSRGKR
jgi:hypothetical protein